MERKLEKFFYDDDIVKMFILASLVWGGAAFLVGLIIALQLAYWPLNLNLEYITFSRLRPLHTNAAIFAFAGNAIFAGIYHSTQRLLKTRLSSDTLSKIHFWGWQGIILAALITLRGLRKVKVRRAGMADRPDSHLTRVVFAVNFRHDH